ncbi:MAG: hypothetical protein GWM98_12140 [Nitrospinaceae bacterium]|nr:hypothetical protein [Nitrospinaceae bacterium]NIR55109.1 hypothetical protein [Nitrospinaceae bacterium]NIS85524.1 hypothetical protein [Nitrospinaceae bacterium]NIT82358.1 hypothetical protein [Nitrospinaceae bacterium]NIU44574.1 hypothetical protein [Nitrospinaceae bacterium]
MAEIKLLDLTDAPVEGRGKKVEFTHPLTEIDYALAVYFAKGRYFAITDACKECQSSLAQGRLEGLYAYCCREQHPWNIKTGLYKFDRRRSLPIYRITVKDGGMYIEI